jgi:response regulator RpfG family c-di-GMP phosphodiesterase
MSRTFGINQRIADRLLADARIGREQHQRAVDYANRQRGRIEEALIELEFMSEGDLLKYISTVHSTRFVSTEKLSKAALNPRVTAKVPAKLALLHGVFPVLLDEKTGVLSVVTADPDNDAALHEVKMAAGVREVRALVARPAAVKAAISQHYHGDKSAFAQLLRPLSVLEMMSDDRFDRTSPKAAPPAAGSAERVQFSTQVASPPQAPGHGTWPPFTEPPISSPPAPIAPAPPAVKIPSAPPGPPPATRVAPASVPPAPPAGRAPAPVAASNEFIETLNVLVSLLENARPDLRGHSSMVARLTRKSCERIGLPAPQTQAFVAAAYLHDLGKTGAYHLTALNVAEYEGHRIAAIKSADLPVHLMESVRLPPETAQAIGSMYERFDGDGFPGGLSGKEIPLGARILAIVDTYADLIQNPRNPYRKTLRPFEACEVLAEYRSTIFDPNLVDVFRQTMTGDDLRAKLLSDRHTALIVDPDPEETTVLELRLIEQGFEVRIARALAQARKELESGDIEVLISEIDLDEADGGFVLRQAALDAGTARDMTWVILTGKTDRQTAQRAFDLGVDDFVAKPASTDIFAAKLRQLIERRSARSGGRGVSGSLAEMSLPDMVQILWHGRKTCALRIEANGSSGEIAFEEGQVVNARWDAIHGENAFYKMITLREGDFRLDPNFKPTSRAITASPEALLLEGMRRLDEGSISG